MTPADINTVAAQGPFQPNWDSLKHYQIPQWYQDAKFGIFIHWGVYSVPAFGSEWYPRNMYQEGTPEFQHHIATYGPQSEFGYKDFVPQFTAAQFDPDAWAKLFAEAGAKFVMPVAEHHDGFAMYDSALSEWTAAKKGPQRDVLGELSESVRHAGMVFTASSHRAEHFWFFDGGRKFSSDVQDPEFDSLYGPAQPAPSDLASLTDSTPTPEFLEDWLLRTCELVDKYRPQIVWFDWWIQQQAFAPYLQTFAAYYYNRAAEWDVEVAINYKYQAFAEGAAVFDVERGQLSGIRPLLWQNDTAVAKNSWGYTESMDYKEAGDLIRDLVDVVSKNGALLLNIGPRPDGTIPDADQNILREIGRWLAVNGQAIYGTRPWKTYGEGPTEIVEGAFTDTQRQPFTGADLRFTMRGDVLYVIALAWPGETLTVHSLGTGAGLWSGSIGGVRLIGQDAPLTFTQNTEALTVALPPAAPGQHAFVFEITP